MVKRRYKLLLVFSLFFTMMLIQSVSFNNTVIDVKGDYVEPISQDNTYKLFSDDLETSRDDWGYIDTLSSSQNNWRNYYDNDKRVTTNRSATDYLDYMRLNNENDEDYFVLDNYARYDVAQLYFDNWNTTDAWLSKNNTEFINTGIYNGSYTFTDDDNGTEPDGWTCNEQGDTIEVIESLDSHNKVLHVQSSLGHPNLYNQFNSTKTFGDIEFWVRTSDGTDQMYMYIRNSDSSCRLQFGIDGDNFVYYDGSTHNILATTDDTWYHVRLAFECGAGGHEGLSSDTFKCWIDGVEYGGFNFRNVGDEIEFLEICVWEAVTDYYFDGIGYSWDNDYEIGDNRYSYNYTILIQEEYAHTTVNQFLHRCDDDGNIESIVIANWIMYKDNITLSIYEFEYDVTFSSPKYSNASYMFYELDSNTESIELRTHIRYGDNESDIQNTYCLFEIIENGDISNKENSTYYCRYYDNPYVNLRESFFNNELLIWNYDSLEDNSTGTSFLTIRNILSGSRHLQGLSNKLSTYDVWIDIPIFNETISNVYAFVDVPDDPYDPEEPTKPRNSDYWWYTTYIITDFGSINIELENTHDFQFIEVDTDYIIEFEKIQGEQRQAKFYYNKETYDKNDFGDWKFTFVTLKVNLNAIRNFFVSIINSLLVIVYYFAYLIVVVINYVFFYLIFAVILPAIWNYVVYYIYYALVWFGYSMVILFLIVTDYILVGLNWLWENLLIPFFEWFLNDGLPLLIEVIVVVFAFILALIIWAATLCQGDFEEIYDQTYELTREIADFLVESIIVLIENLPALLLYILMYILLTFYCLLKHVYAKAKGYVNRSVQLKESYEAYMYPILIAKAIIVWFKELIGRWT